MNWPPVAPAGLLESFLGQLPPATVTLVEAAATVRRVTEPMLSFVLRDDGHDGDGFDALRAPPFVEETADGILLHDVVRDACFPSARPSHAVEPATARDAAAIAESTARRLEVLRLVAAGHSNREIGELLFISEKTASRHLSNIFGTLGIRTRAGASRIAAEQGLTATER